MPRVKAARHTGTKSCTAIAAAVARRRHRAVLRGREVLTAQEVVGQLRCINGRLACREGGLRLHTVVQLLVAKTLRHATGTVAGSMVVAA
jgi:hypothetical protein